MARQQRVSDKPNRWFAMLRAHVADDLEERGHLPDLSTGQVLSWADAHHARTGQWPTWQSGEIPEAPGEIWLGVQAALYLGLRGFSGRLTLARLLKEQRGVPINGRPPKLSKTRILRWADEHHHRTGSWPTGRSAPVLDAPGENWNKIDQALRHGRRGLSSGLSLARLLAERRGVPNPADRPRLKVKTSFAGRMPTTAARVPGR